MVWKGVAQPYEFPGNNELRCRGYQISNVLGTKFLPKIGPGLDVVGIVSIGSVIGAKAKLGEDCP